MNTWYFWKSWHPQSRGFLLLLMGLFSLLVLYFTYHYFKSPAAVIDWQKISAIDKVSVEADEFRVGLFDFSYQLDNYAVSESFRAGSIQSRPAAAYLHLGILSLSLVVLLTLVSALRGFWFYFGVLVVSGLFISLRLEQLMLFGSYDKTGLLLALALYLPALYYFAYLKTAYSLLTRLMVFLAITLVTGIFFFLAAEVAYPMYYLANYSLPASMVLSLVFILLIGHSLISFFLKIVTRGNTIGSKNSTWHFLAVSVIYLLNLFLLFLYNTGRIDWDILYLNAFFVFVVASILGLWDFRDREVQYIGAFSFAPLGAFFYLALAMVTFSTLAYVFLTANDPVMEALEDAIIYSQIGYGLIFMFYVIGNFIQPLMDNQQVWRIMYKPPNFPYGTAQITGLIATLAFFLNANLFPFYQAVAGYYNALADTYLLSGDTFLAEQYYKMGDQYGYNNHRSNYALGSLARAQNDSKLAPFYFSEALKKRPTPYAQVNLGYELLQGDRFFDALFSFREGLDAFPGNPYLHVNLGVTFGKTDVLDSALYYLQEAADEEVSRAAARTNILGLVAKNEDLLAFDLDSLINETNYGEEYLPARVNELLLYNRYLPGKLRQKDVWQVPEDSVLNSFDFAYLYNYAFNSPAVLDSSRRAMLQKLAENPANGNFYEALLLIRAYVLYQNNQVVDAMKTLDYLQSLNPFRRGEYNNILGLWAMQMHAPQVATTYLRKAVAARHDGSLFRHAVAEAEAMALPGGNQREAFQAWDSLRILEKEGIRETQAVVSDMLSIVSGNAALADRDGAFIYQYLRYRAPFMSEAAIGRALDSIEEPSYRVLALHDLMLRFPRRDFEAVKTRANRLLDSKPKLSGQALAYQAWLEVWLLQTQGEEAAAAREASQLEPLSTWHRLKQHYLQATLARQQGEEATARVLARRLLGNPFYEEGFLFALSYLYADEPLRQYELLLDALETYPYSPELLKAYTRSSLQQGLESYAENALEDLRGLLAPEAFASYLQEYESLKEELSVSF